MKTFRAFRGGQGGGPPETSRSVAQLMEASQQHAEARRRREAERETRERMRRDQEEAAAREKHLASLAKREPDAWLQVDALIATKRPSDYEVAVQLLKDLAELDEKRGRQAEVRDRLARLQQEHARKPTLLRRLRAAGLLAD
jgi:TPR repeat protein